MLPFNNAPINTFMPLLAFNQPLKFLDDDNSGLILQ